MKHSFFLSISLLTSLCARENPFFAIDPAKNSKITSNVIESKPVLGSVNYVLPDQARVLKEVTFTIQNLDGSVEQRKMVVDQSIDWHRPITLSQGGQIKPAMEKKSGTSSADFGFIRFDANGKRLSIITKDPLARHFVLSDPSRIVLDFKKSALFQADEKNLNSGVFQSVAITNHAKFARATITLDGRYRYELTKNSGEIIIICK